ncbi:UDP-glucose/GDP-mannose dehydrogenase family protein [Klugiella xanthotipulae]
MAELGHEVVGIDLDESKVRSLSEGVAPFYEPGLPEVLRSALDSGRLRFSSDPADARGARVHFIAVGTPQKSGSSAADMTYVDSAINALIPALSPGDLVVGKSTVPVGTAQRLSATLRDAGTGALLAWNPEFLREGFAIQDTISPDRLVYGLPAGIDGETARALMDEVYAAALAAGTPLVPTDYATAELVKVSANAFLATKISFINAMAEIAEVTGADVTQLADAIGHDVRIGRRFLNAGVGFGGGCLPKDIRAFSARADELGVGHSLGFLKEMDAINLRRRDRVVALALRELGAEFPRKKVAALGLAFKPNSDDVRDSPALEIATRLAAEGTSVTATDPEALRNAQRVQPQLTYTASIDDALRGADLVIVATEWVHFRELDPVIVRELVTTPTIIDARNCLDADRWRAAGWTYIGLGRP